MPDLSAFRSKTYSFEKKFLLTVYKGIYKTKIKMECAPTAVNTGQLPHTYKVLRSLLPSVFRTRCYNENNYPFSVEVKKTELAHLFEHVMLEYLCQYKIAMGHKRVSFAGVTDWNWRDDPYGTFHITLEIGKREQMAFDHAFKKSVALFESLFNEKQMA